VADEIGKVDRVLYVIGVIVRIHPWKRVAASGSPAKPLLTVIDVDVARAERPGRSSFPPFAPHQFMHQFDGCPLVGIAASAVRSMQLSSFSPQHEGRSQYNLSFSCRPRYSNALPFMRLFMFSFTMSMYDLPALCFSTLVLTNPQSPASSSADDRGSNTPLSLMASLDDLRGSGMEILIQSARRRRRLWMLQTLRPVHYIMVGVFYGSLHARPPLSRPSCSRPFSPSLLPLPRS
jgi:hypothetical protein